MVVKSEDYDDWFQPPCCSSRVTARAALSTIEIAREYFIRVGPMTPTRAAAVAVGVGGGHEADLAQVRARCARCR